MCFKNALWANKVVLLNLLSETFKLKIVPLLLLGFLATPAELVSGAVVAPKPGWVSSILFFAVIDGNYIQFENTIRHANFVPKLKKIL